MHDSLLELEIQKFLEERNGYLKEINPDAIGRAFEVYKNVVNSENYDKNKNYHWILGQFIKPALDAYCLPDDEIGQKFLGYWYTISYAEDKEYIIEFVEG